MIKTTYLKSNSPAMFMKRISLYYLSLSLLLFSGCSLFSEEPEVDNSTSPSLSPKYIAELEEFMDAESAFEAQRFGIALTFYRKILDKFPASPLSILAELKAADSLFQLQRYPEAVEGYRGFLNVNPTHEAASFAQFRIALSFYNSYKGIGKDDSPLTESRKEFKKVLIEYPRSEWSSHSLNYIKKIDGLLLTSEKHVLEFYAKIGDSQAALARKNAAKIRFSDMKLSSVFLDSDHLDYDTFLSEKSISSDQSGESKIENKKETPSTPVIITRVEKKKGHELTVTPVENPTSAMVESKVSKADVEKTEKVFGVGPKPPPHTPSTIASLEGRIGKYSNVFTLPYSAKGGDRLQEPLSLETDQKKIVQGTTTSSIDNSRHTRKLSDTPRQANHHIAPKHHLGISEKNSNFLIQATCIKFRSEALLKLTLSERAYLKSMRPLDKADSTLTEITLLNSPDAKLSAGPHYFTTSLGWILIEQKSCASGENTFEYFVWKKSSPNSNIPQEQAITIRTQSTSSQHPKLTQQKEGLEVSIRLNNK